jgi:hypothetical protein
MDFSAQRQDSSEVGSSPGTSLSLLDDPERLPQSTLKLPQEEATV